MINCPVCESPKTKLLLNWKKFKIQKCRNCKLIFTTPLPSEKELADFYQGFMFKKPEDYEVRKQLIKRKQEISKRFGLANETADLSTKRFLDYGGGTGVVYKAVSEMGLDSYYHDLDEQAKQFSIENFGLKEEKIIGDIKQSQLLFDYIFSDNVIEHVLDPHQFLQDLLKPLKAGGRLVIKTPHASSTDLLFNPMISIKHYFLNALKYNSFLSSLQAYLMRFWCCDPPRHLYSFSKKSLDQLMIKNQSENTSHQIGYYEVPWFENTITKQFFSKDKRLKGIASLAVRLIIFPIIPIETVLQVVRKLLLRLKLLSPGGIILIINKNH